MNKDVKYLTPKRSVKEIHGTERRAASVHDVTNEGQNTKPSATPSMWTRIGNPLDEFPEWVQPIGAHDAYAKGDKASHNGKNWVSTADNNVWEPGVYGWEEATQATAVAADEGDGE